MSVAASTSLNHWQINVFGVRHLSPGGAWHLRRYLDRLQPQLVLVEGLADAAELTTHLVKKGTKPPVAILAYTATVPVRTLVYPLAKYSPEFQAIIWAHVNHIDLQFIDLPSDIFLGLQDQEIERNEKARRRADESTGSDAGGDLNGKKQSDGTSDALNAPQVTESLYVRLARQCGEDDYDAFWERNFEHNRGNESYRRAAYHLGASLREIDSDHPERHAETLIREAYMRRRIEEAIERGVDPGKIVAVVGAFHAPVLHGGLPAITDDELARLPRRDSKLTLMPYSYFRLSSQSGYGAGNSAPAYYEMMWESLQHEDLDGLATRYLSLVARHVRDNGTHRSTAEVIEAVRLAKTLTALKDGMAPTLSDLHDAAITLIGHGDRASVAEAIAHVDVGTAIGELPKGVSRTSIQDDFDRELSRLRLEKFRTTVKQDLTLDLRENRQAKTESSAFLDLGRSSFLHRLRVLEVQFASHVSTRQQSATWAEAWQLQWSPESEISLVEAVLLGDTVELATAYKFKLLIEKAGSIESAAVLVRDACQCGMIETMDVARKRVQELSAESSAFGSVASAAFELMQVVRYGDVRKFDCGPLVPMIEELFVQGCLSLHEAANCDPAAAKNLVVAIDSLNRVSLDFYSVIDEEMWKERLQALSDADDRNPVLSGLACAILLERGWMDNDRLSREVSRRLSPGISADLGAGWFEGLAKRNRYALIARQSLWEQLDQYIGSLDEPEFRRSLVFLRRAFGDFSPQEKRNIAENLAQLWGVTADEAAEVLDGPLSESEEQALSDLNDFDFGDL